MKLYVCYGTFPTPRPGGHPCRNAHQALRAAGYDPEVVRVYGLGSIGPLTPGRRQVKRLTGSPWVPALVADNGEVIHESHRIIEWARAHPAYAGGATPRDAQAEQPAARAVQGEPPDA